MSEQRTWAAALRAVRRCIRAERKAANTVAALAGWGGGEQEDRALAAARRRTNAALRALAAGPPQSTPELSPEHPARPLSEHLATLSECGEGLVSIDGEAYWIDAADQAALRRALAPRDAESDGAVVWAAAKALSATQPRRAELLRAIAARLGCGGGTPTGDTGEIAAGPQNRRSVEGVQWDAAIRDLQRCRRCGRRRIEHRVDNIGLARCSDDGDADFREEGRDGD